MKAFLATQQLKKNFYSSNTVNNNNNNEQEGDSDTNCCCCTWNGLQRLWKETGEIENQKKKRDHPDHSIV